MLKKSVATLFVTALLASTGISTVAHAATISNGSACAKSGVSTTVKVKGVSKAYICKINPAVAGATTPTCLRYWAAAKNSQNSINEQRSLVQSMSEPDKTNYGKALDASQASLDKVIAAIKANHCKVGL